MSSEFRLTHLANWNVFNHLNLCRVTCCVVWSVTRTRCCEGVIATLHSWQWIICSDRLDLSQSCNEEFTHNHDLIKSAVSSRWDVSLTSVSAYNYNPSVCSHYSILVTLRVDYDLDYKASSLTDSRLFIRNIWLIKKSNIKMTESRMP